MYYFLRKYIFFLYNFRALHLNKKLFSVRIGVRELSEDSPSIKILKQIVKPFIILSVTTWICCFHTYSILGLNLVLLENNLLSIFMIKTLLLIVRYLKLIVFTFIELNVICTHFYYFILCINFINKKKKPRKNASISTFLAIFWW